MVGAVSARRFAHRAASAAALARLAVVAALFGVASMPLARAADLPDPTRPPAAQRPGPGGSAPAASASAAPVLQSVLIGEGRKPSAIINGRLLQLGDAYDEMRLTRVDETGAVLTGARGRTVLALTPGADKVAVGTLEPRKFGATIAPAAVGVPVLSPPLRVAEQK